MFWGLFVPKQLIYVFRSSSLIEYFNIKYSSRKTRAKRSETKLTLPSTPSINYSRFQVPSHRQSFLFLFIYFLEIVTIIYFSWNSILTHAGQTKHDIILLVPEITIALSQYGY